MDFSVGLHLRRQQNLRFMEKRNLRAHFEEGEEIKVTEHMVGRAHEDRNLKACRLSQAASTYSLCVGSLLCQEKRDSKYSFCSYSFAIVLHGY